MSWGYRERPSLTAAQLAVEHLLTRLKELPVGQTVMLADRAQDGFGGLVVKKASPHTLVFQRSGFQGRSRWADGPEQAREELRSYVATGKLREPDNVKGF